ncbi:MAG: hypothetical protein ACI9YH_000637 [Colwellia sp.]|jgi:hypothetical protein
MKFILSFFLCISSYANSNNINSFASGKANEKNNKYVQDYMITFSSQEKNRWRITNDGVMGGLSYGKMIVEKGSGTFSGQISLDNNGGFSSVFRAVEDLSPSLNKLVIDIEGDGQLYQLRLMTNINGYRLAYKHDFKTTANKREKFIFQLTDFQATFRGRNINNAPLLTSEDIRDVGFLMTKKITGKFALSVFQLSFFQE